MSKTIFRNEFPTDTGMILIDTCQFDDGEYEIIVLSKANGSNYGDELDVERTNDLNKARDIHNKFVWEYGTNMEDVTYEA